MIIGAEIPLKIGDIINQDTRKGFKLKIVNNKPKKYTFMVMRAATEKEYLEYYLKEYQRNPHTPSPFKYFYEISID